MKKINLNGIWQLSCENTQLLIPAVVPGSVYSALLYAGKMEDPYYRDNEMQACRLLDHDYVYKRLFTLTDEDLYSDELRLIFHGLDTLADVYVNDQWIGHADNMHRTWAFDITDHVIAGENTLTVILASPTQFVEEAWQKNFIDGSSDCTRGFPHIRKSHCMFGWDWGPRLPDAGIWRDAEIHCIRKAVLEGLRIHQEHSENEVTLSFFPEIEKIMDCDMQIRITVTAPDGQHFVSDGHDLTISNPKLWWPNGLGEQPLYQVHGELICEDETLDTLDLRIGLRTLTVDRTPDEFGESFRMTVNGIPFFSMGGDYIPEDNIRSRITPDRTRQLIADCKMAHHNSIRVWGGGYYPDNWFYDACDEAGLVVWQDFMFACAMYDLTPELDQNIRQEVKDNVRRLRHHASLGLWCANNEMEWQVDTKVYQMTPKHYGDYIRMYEYIIPQALREMDPDTFFWPSSPSSGGSFDNPNDPNRGDVHYWDVWHQNKPFPDYRNYFFRYASEFGFQSFPALKTVETFTEPEDRNIFSYVMEKHQRNNAANGKIMNYMAQTFLYPNDFDTLIYASQLLQAEAIRYGVEHWRRNRGRCMGAIYWQLNDCWPVASWSSIDYFGRWKALHYASRRFFAPVLLSCQEEGTLTQNTNVNAQPLPMEKSAWLNVSNETMRDVNCKVLWSLRNPKGDVIMSGEEKVYVPALGSVWLEKLDFSDEPLYERYFSYQLLDDQDHWISSGSVLFCAPKHFRFQDPKLSIEVNGDTLMIHSEAYARGVEILAEDGDVILADNYFDMDPGCRCVQILRGHATKFTVRSVYNIR